MEIIAEVLLMATRKSSVKIPVEEEEMVVEKSWKKTKQDRMLAVLPLPRNSGQVGVSKNNGIPKSSILIGFSTINHPFWATPIFGNTQVMVRDHPTYRWSCKHESFR